MSRSAVPKYFTERLEAKNFYHTIVDYENLFGNRFLLLLEAMRKEIQFFFVFSDLGYFFLFLVIQSLSTSNVSKTFWSLFTSFISGVYHREIPDFASTKHKHKRSLLVNNTPNLHSSSKQHFTDDTLSIINFVLL